MELKKQLHKAGYRQDYVARKVGISDAYLSKILNGKRKPKDQTICERIKNVILKK